MGSAVVIKSSYAIENRDTLYRLSIFSNADNLHAVLEGRRLGDSVLLRGYWRKLVNTRTGPLRLIIPYQQGARQLFASQPDIRNDSIVLSGLAGEGNSSPANAIRLRYRRPLNQTGDFHILAHRAGGRTADLLPYSENSLGMMRFASRLGATGVEIDICLTRDMVPIVYHDKTLNLRLIQKNGLVGEIKNYSYDQLYTYVRLLDGQRIPGLREALHTIVYETPLRYVWLDIKFDGPLDRVRELQREFKQRANAIGRQVEIVIGLPDEASFNQFRRLPGYRNIPSLCELTTEDARTINAQVWAPRFTLGLQTDDVMQMQSEGRQAFVWTLDEPQYVNQFINQGQFNGILSNYPSLVAFYYYVKI
jgi:glycerophosphoryl diester phosphodiesterase